MTKTKGGQRIAVNIATPKRHSRNQYAHTKISMHVDLGFRAEMTRHEELYLAQELRIAIRTALILQFGLKAAMVEPAMADTEEKFVLDLFKASGVADHLK